LAEPILVPLETPERDADGKLIVRMDWGLFLKQLQKMELLAQHYGVAETDHFNLAFRLARDFVPGFRILYDDPGTRALKLPNAYYGKGTKPKGSGAIPETLDGQTLVLWFKMLAKAFPDETEVTLADHIVLAIKPELKGIRYETQRKATSKTIRNRLARARRAKAP
jgi:hypothetical protein